MITSGNTKTGDVVIENGKKEGFPSKLCKTCAYYADDGSEDENSYVKPVKV